MATKTIKKETAQKKTAVKKAMTNAERQQRFRNKQKKFCSVEKEARIISKLKEELTNILKGLSYSELYAIAPLIRYMKYIKEKIDKYSVEYICAEINQNLDLSMLPDALFNRTDEENAAYNEEWDELSDDDKY